MLPHYRSLAYSYEKPLLLLVALLLAAIISPHVEAQNTDLLAEAPQDLTGSTWENGQLTCTLSENQPSSTFLYQGVDLTSSHLNITYRVISNQTEAVPLVLEYYDAHDPTQTLLGACTLQHNPHQDFIESLYLNGTSSVRDLVFRVHQPALPEESQKAELEIEEISLAPGKLEIAYSQAFGSPLEKRLIFNIDANHKETMANVQVEPSLSIIQNRSDRPDRRAFTSHHESGHLTMTSPVISAPAEGFSLSLDLVHFTEVRRAGVIASVPELFCLAYDIGAQVLILHDIKNKKELRIPAKDELRKTNMTTFVYNNWHHIILEYQPELSQVALIINTHKIATLPLSNTEPKNKITIQLGSCPTIPGNFTGRLNNLEVYQGFLGTEDLNSLYHRYREEYLTAKERYPALDHDS